MEGREEGEGGRDTGNEVGGMRGGSEGRRDEGD